MRSAYFKCRCCRALLHRTREECHVCGCNSAKGEGLYFWDMFEGVVQILALLALLTALYLTKPFGSQPQQGQPVKKEQPVKKAPLPPIKIKKV